MALYTVADARVRFSKHLLLNVTPDNLEQFKPLRALLAEYPGQCGVHIHYVNGEVKQILPLAPQFGVLPEDNLLDALMQLLAPDSVQVCY